MQQDPHQEHFIDRAVATGRLGGQKRMARLSPQERSVLARHAARARWHPREAQAQRERAQEIVHLIKEALKENE